MLLCPGFCGYCSHCFVRIGKLDHHHKAGIKLGDLCDNAFSSIVCMQGTPIANTRIRRQEITEITAQTSRCVTTFILNNRVYRLPKSGAIWRAESAIKKPDYQ